MIIKVNDVKSDKGYRATPNVEKLVSISAMPAYNTKSHEELRLEDYMTGKRMFDFFQKPSTSPPKHPSSSSFLIPTISLSDNHKEDSFASNHLATSTWTSAGTSSQPSYRPTTYVGPVSTSGGYRATSNVEKLVSISAMPAYNTKSHEELRKPITLVSPCVPSIQKCDEEVTGIIGLRLILLAHHLLQIRLEQFLLVVSRLMNILDPYQFNMGYPAYLSKTSLLLSGGEIFVSTKIEDEDYFPFMFVIRFFLPYFIFPEISSLLLSAKSEDTIFDPSIFD
nr:hypothetical protein [Tanacetum cinerariifolium]